MCLHAHAFVTDAAAMFVALIELFNALKCISGSILSICLFFHLFHLGFVGFGLFVPVQQHDRKGNKID